MKRSSRVRNTPALTVGLVPRGVTHVSFDIFGTCLVRSTGQPSGLYRALGQEIATRLLRPAEPSFAEDFIEWRSEAERLARRRSMREEVSLEDIWRVLAELLGPDSIAGLDGPALEMQLERSGLRPIAPMRDRIVRERAAGRRILFISDSCLPHAFLAEELRRHGFAQAEDAVFVSSESGLMKRSGALYRHVLAKTPLSAAALHHVGNHPSADVDAPRRLGISAELFGDAEWKPVERLLLWRRPVAAGPWMTVANELTVARLAQSQNDAGKSGAVNLVEEFLGPFLCVFGHWVLRQAIAAGRERLYFASRDTRLLWRVCKTLVETNPKRMDLRYLLVSRQAIALPAIRDISPAGMPWLRRDFEAATVPNLLHRCELSYVDCGGEWTRLRPGWAPETPLKSPLDWATFWTFLRSPPIRSRLEANIERRKRDALLYLKKEGLFDTTPMGFVDFGWFLTCQAAINRLVKYGGANAALEGYYLGLRQSRIGPAETGRVSAIFREGPEDLPVAPHLAWMQRHHIIELIAGLCDQPSVRKYGNGGAVEYVADSSMLGTARFREIEAAVAAYATNYGTAWKPIADDDTEVAKFLGTLLNELFQRPPESLVQTLQEIAFSPDPGRENSQKLIEPYSWQDAFRAAFVARPSRLEAGWRWWPEASAIATPQPRRFLREAGRAWQRLLQNGS